MSAPDQRDPELTRTTLQAWLHNGLPDAAQVAVSVGQTLAYTGFPAETLMFQASWLAGCRWAGQERAAGREGSAGRLPDLPRSQVQRAVPAATDPGRYRHSHADSALAQARSGRARRPVLMMSRIGGAVPADMPPHHQASHRELGRERVLLAMARQSSALRVPAAC